MADLPPSWILITGFKEHPQRRRRTDVLKCSAKFCVDVIYCGEDITISILLTLGLKLLDQAALGRYPEQCFF